MPKQNPYKKSQIGQEGNAIHTLSSSNTYVSSHSYRPKSRRYIVLMVIYFVVFAAVVLALSYFSSRVLKMDFMQWPRNVWDAAFVKWFQVDFTEESDFIGTIIKFFQGAWMGIKCFAWGISFIVLMIVGFLCYVLMFVAIPCVVYLLFYGLGYWLLHFFVDVDDEDVCYFLLFVLMVLELIAMYLFLLL